MNTQTQYKEEPYTEARMQELKGVPGVMLKYTAGRTKYSYRFTAKNGSVVAESEGGIPIYYFPEEFAQIIILIPNEKTYVPFERMEEVPLNALLYNRRQRRHLRIIGVLSDGRLYVDDGCETLVEAFALFEIVHQNPDGTIKLDENGNWVTSPFGKEVVK